MAGGSRIGKSLVAALPIVFLLTLFVLLAPCVLTESASATTAPATAFPLSGTGDIPTGIAAGADGNLWFTEWGAMKIGRITPAGEITEFPLPGEARPGGIAAGPEGDLWFTESRELGAREQKEGRIGRITPSGAITEFFLAGEPSSGAITAGPEGDIWFTIQGAEIGRIPPKGAITEFPIPDSRTAWSITDGTEGKLWFGQAGEVGSMTSGGVVAEYPFLPGEKGLVDGITARPEGAVWFTEAFSLIREERKGEEEVQNASRIGRISSGGQLTQFPRSELDGLGLRYPAAITAGPEGNMWFTAPFSGGFRGPSGDQIGRISPGGRISFFEPIPATGTPAAITAGPDGNLWFTASSEGALYSPGTSEIVRLTPPPREPPTVEIRSSLATVHSHRVKISLECGGGAPGDACHGMLSLRVGPPHTDVVRRPFSLPWESNRSVAFRLNRRAVSLLARKSVIASFLTATLSGGQTASGKIALVR